MVTFPPSPSPKLLRTRRAPPPPAPGRLLRTRSPGQGQALRARVAAATSIPVSSGCGGWTQTGSEEGTGSPGITWAAARASAGRAQPGSRRRDAGRAVGAGWLPRCPRPATQPAPPPPQIKRPTPGPRRPRPPSPLRSVTRAALAGSGFHWWPRRPPGSARRPRPPRPFPGARGRGAGAPGWPRALRGALAPAARSPSRPQRAVVGQQRDRDNFLQVQNGALPASEGLRSGVPPLETHRSRF